MIFVTVGSHPTFGFDRLISALAPISTENDLVVQYGPAPAPEFATVAAYPWLPFDQVLDYMRQADVVISHAGVGSFLCARQLGHRPIVAPRRSQYGETVDDHQVELARALEGSAGLVVAWEMSELPDLVGRARLASRGETAGSGERRLHAAVRAALLA